MKTVKVVFKDGVFLPLEQVDIPNGTEGVAVYLSKREIEAEKPSWWRKLEIDEKQKEAILAFSKEVTERAVFDDIRVVKNSEGLEVFVIVPDEFESLKPIMEAALGIYETHKVYLPVQVISEKRLSRWQEQGNRIYKSIEEGVSIT